MSMSKEDFWREHVESWGKSGLSQGKYARQADISHSALCYWKRKLERTQTPGISHPLVVPVPVKLFSGHGVNKTPEGSRSGTFRLHLGAYGLEIPPDFTVPALTRLLDCLERRS